MTVWHWYAQHDLDDVDYQLDGMVEAVTEDEAVALVRKVEGYDEYAWDVWVGEEAKPNAWDKVIREPQETEES